MSLLRFLILGLVASPALAQVEAQCIVAGRINEAGHWAPRFDAVQLRAGDGRVIARADRASLARVRQAELAQPALLSRCDGDSPLPRADEQPPFTKEPAPALSRGMVDVESVAFPKLRTGGVLVELKVRVPAERVVMLTR